MSEFYEYEDAQLRMRIPVYLRPKKGMRHFIPVSKVKKRDIWLLSVDLPTKEMGDLSRNVILKGNARPMEWKGVKTEVLRRAPSPYVPISIELLTRNDNTITGEALFFYQLVFEVDKRYVDLTIAGRHDLQKFEELCKEIVTSIKLNGGAPAKEGMSEFYEYEDAELRMQLPIYLRPKNNTRFFAPSGEKSKDREIYAIAVSFVEDQGSINRYRSGMSVNETGKKWNQDGVITTVLRQGKSNFVEDGFESISKTHILATGDLLFNYSVFFDLNSRHVLLSIAGRSNQAGFEKVCERIVSSIELKKGASEIPAVKNRNLSAGLNRADKARLGVALHSLPLELRYLHKPILAIAKQDQDLLGSGEADIGPAVRALSKIAQPAEIMTVAANHSRLLREWLEALPDYGDSWAAPAWFVVGALAGGVLFDPSEE